MNQEHTIVFTDGSSSGNPGPGGWAAIVACSPGSPAAQGAASGTVPCDVVELGGREERTTNNRMELQGVISALKYLEKTPGKIMLYTDSSYVVQGITLWIKGWLARGWITSTKQPVVNRDLWEQLHALVETRKLNGPVVWNQIEGHAGVPGNERADIIATAFTANQTPDLYNGPQASYPVNLFVTAADPAKKAAKSAKSSSKSRSQQKAYSYISRVGDEILTHKTWAECEARVKGATGARFKKALSADEEAAIIAEFKKT